MTAGPNAPPPIGNGRMANISTRMRVGIGDNVMIGGFIIQGTRAKKIIIRALVPSTHLAGALANPLVVGVQHPSEIVIGVRPARDVVAGAKDADAGHDRE